MAFVIAIPVPAKLNSVGVRARWGLVIVLEPAVQVPLRPSLDLAALIFVEELGRYVAIDIHGQLVVDKLIVERLGVDVVEQIIGESRFAHIIEVALQKLGLLLGGFSRIFDLQSSTDAPTAIRGLALIQKIARINLIRAIQLQDVAAVWGSVACLLSNV